MRRKKQSPIIVFKEGVFNPLPRLHDGGTPRFRCQGVFAYEELWGKIIGNTPTLRSLRNFFPCEKSWCHYLVEATTFGLLKENLIPFADDLPQASRFWLDAKDESKDFETEWITKLTRNWNFEWKCSALLNNGAVPDKSRSEALGKAEPRVYLTYRAFLCLEHYVRYVSVHGVSEWKNKDPYFLFFNEEKLKDTLSGMLKKIKHCPEIFAELLLREYNKFDPENELFWERIHKEDAGRELGDESFTFSNARESYVTRIKGLVKELAPRLVKLIEETRKDSSLYS